MKIKEIVPLFLFAAISTLTHAEDVGDARELIRSVHNSTGKQRSAGLEKIQQLSLTEQIYNRIDPVNGDSAFQNAIELMDAGVVGAMIKGGADPNQAFRYGLSPLRTVILSIDPSGDNRDQVKLFKYLLKADADVDRAYSKSEGAAMCQTAITTLMNQFSVYEKTSQEFSESAKATMYLMLEAMLASPTNKDWNQCGLDLRERTRLNRSHKMCEIVLKYNPKAAACDSD